MSRADVHGLAGGSSGPYYVPLRGRAREVTEVDRGFAEALAGGRAVTVLTGEPGSGKTRLIQHALHVAQQRDVFALVLAPDIDSRMTPLGAIIDAVTCTTPPLMSVPHVASMMRGPSPQYWLTRTIANGVEAIARTSPVLVVVDDLQYLDAVSVQTIRTLLRDLQGLPIYWLATTHTGHFSNAHQRFMAEVTSLGGVVHELPPLADADVEAITRDVIGGTPGPRVRHALLRTGGLPLLVLELTRGLAEEGLLHSTNGVIDIDGDALPLRLGASVRGRMTNLSSAALRIAQVGSLYGREFPLTAVLDLLEQTATQAAPAVQELLDMSLVIDTGANLAFRHDTIQAAAGDSLTPSLRRAFARDMLARRLEAGEGVGALATVIASVAHGEDPESITLLLAAASELSRTDVQGAAELVVLGARLTSGTDRNAHKLADLLPLVLASGRIEEAMTIVESLKPLLGPEARARVSLALARQLTETDFDAAIRQTSSGLEIAGISDETRVQLHAVRALNFANKADPVGLLTSLESARALAHEERDELALATIDATESVLVFNQGDFDTAEELQRRAVARIARTDTSVGLWMPEGLWMAFMRNSAGFCREAAELIDDGLAQARAASNILAEAYWMMTRARVLYDLGQLDEARTQAETVMDLGTQLGLGDFLHATAGVVLHRIALRTGDTRLRDESRPLVQRLAEGDGLTRTGQWSLVLEAMERGRPNDAYLLAAPVLESLRQPIPSMTTPADFADDITLAFICREAGQRPALELVTRVAAERADANPDNALVRAVANATRGICHDSVADLLAAVDEMRSVPRPLVVARIFEGAGRVNPDDDASTGALLSAARLYQDHGSTRDADRVLQALRSRGIFKRPQRGSDGPSGLSKRELQVAERVHSGLTTQQIADELHVSPHTVVTYIRHIYAKWGVNSRRDVVERYALLADLRTDG